MDMPTAAAGLPADEVTTPPYVILRPARQTVPLVVASPHSGRSYAAAFLQAARLGPLDLRRSEDTFVEELFAAAVDHGAPMLCAQFPRAYCDYHDALASLIAQTRSQFGACLLIDCHSMPAGTGRFAEPQVVLGDAHGTACMPRITSLAESILSDFGYHVRRNDPYAGGYVTRHYGRPRERVHALQVEVARRLYMNEATLEKSAGFGMLQEQLGCFVGRLATELPRLL